MKRTSSPDGGLFPDKPQPILSFDEVRGIWTGIGLALYALEPGGPVTLEIYSEGEVYRFDAATAEEAIALAFPTRQDMAEAAAENPDVFG